MLPFAQPQKCMTRVFSHKVKLILVSIQMQHNGGTALALIYLGARNPKEFPQARSQLCLQSHHHNIYFLNETSLLFRIFNSIAKSHR